jgi:hypothetical protein
MNDRNDWTAWDWLKAATEAGWEDPGETEPLDKTAARAREYLERRAETQWHAVHKEITLAEAREMFPERASDRETAP